ncbi:ABC transporter permease (plasmid) [Aminobacter sp. SR38]|jgi:putative spermidine/putrescine transport system permease protein|uniref:ABC transporter permease n=1 Tax=Aminobacter sp. SR38 TaxID=2774562 RepID=UPI00177B66A2|nr:ABC transporter permease [Aminobacter sp. SR38]QOF75715.1 ABC transporter permease [Aminobacter sp. SR38]
MNTLGLWHKVGVALTIAFLAAPVLVIVSVAFTSAEFVSFPPSGFSLRWFGKVLTDTQFVFPLWNSFVLAIAATSVSVILAVPAAIALVRSDLPFKSGLLAFMLSPLSLPTIILAAALLFFLARFGLGTSAVGLLIGHVVITVPYVLRTVVGVYAGIGTEVEEAARTLGARRWQVFWYVTLPMIRPGLLAGGILAFLLSFDEVAVALLLSTADTTTLPVAVLSYLVYNYDPAVAAISTIQIGIVVVLLLVLERFLGVKHLIAASK